MWHCLKYEDISTMVHLQIYFFCPYINLISKYVSAQSLHYVGYMAILDTRLDSDTIKLIVFW